MHLCNFCFHLQTGALLLEPHLQSILFWLFWRWGGLMNYLPWLALNQDPPDLSLSSSYDYRCEPLAPCSFKVFYPEVYIINTKNLCMCVCVCVCVCVCAHNGGGVKPRALYIIIMCFTTELHPQPRLLMFVFSWYDFLCRSFFINFSGSFCSECIQRRVRLSL
jgi:hypothetical protein